MTVRQEKPVPGRVNVSAIYTPEVLEELRANPGVSYLVETNPDRRPSTWAPRQRHEDLRLKSVATDEGYCLYALSTKGMKVSEDNTFDDCVKP